ncbi:ECF-type sigma factor [Tahibacter amnicola]|uniref:ECF-type sigma factor n=1 Tax=Tahibacter amnicola TaxID=2976241 RepID=A0ABY6BEU4_9GAMM|nr:ECF-type sigma factor [Tahibacter amnicola]UXI68558.1 ECF-type sigma factor [Tahibacter amnicola]
MSTNDSPITELLSRWRAGATDAESRLMEAVYPVLRELARSRLHRGRHGLTLQPTELVNEAYARLQLARETPWEGRVHFFAMSARIIRGLAIDFARARASEKRGGDMVFVELDKAEDIAGSEPAVDLLALDQALEALERDDPVSARIVELKFFSGLTTEEIAEACEISTASVVRYWRFARAWLGDRLSPTRPGDAD